MHTRLFYYYFIFLSIILASCKQNKEQAPELDLDDIMVIYCTPTDLAQCLPLEITKDANGWKAEYVGTPSMERKQLKPRLSLDEIGDTIVVFDEYMGESFNGSYFLCRGTELFPHYRELFYCNSQNQDTVFFYARIVNKSDILIDPQDIDSSFELLTQDQDPFSCSSEQRDLNLTYLFHSNPKTLIYKFKEDDYFETCTSEDSVLRIYMFHCWTGGCGMGSNFVDLTAQYKTKDVIVTIDDFPSILLGRMNDFDGANFPNCYRINIYQATLNEKKHYLVETVFSDPTPRSFEGGVDADKCEDLVLFAYTIENGKLMPSNILEGESMIELVSVECGDDIHFKYDDADKRLYIPMLNQSEHTFTGEYREIRII